MEVRGDSETLRRDCVCWMTWNAALAFHDWIDGEIVSTKGFVYKYTFGRFGSLNLI